MSNFVKVYGVSTDNDRSLREAQLMWRRVDHDLLEIVEEDLSRLQEITGITLTQYDALYVSDGVSLSDSLGGRYGDTSPYWVDCWRDPAADHNIVVKLHKLNGNTADDKPIFDGCLHIWGYTYPRVPNMPSIRTSGIGKLELEGEEFNFARDYGQGDAFSLSALSEVYADDPGFDMVFDSANRLFAITCPFNAYIPLNMEAVPSDGHARPHPNLWAPFAKKIIDATMGGDLEQILADARRLENQRVLQDYESLCSGKHQQKIEETRKIVKEKNDSVVRLREELTESIRSITEFNAVLAVAESIEPDPAVFEAEFAKILENPLIEKVDVDGDNLLVYTSEIYIDGDTSIKAGNQSIRDKWAGLVVPLGKFKISMNSRGSINFQNLTNPKSRDGDAEVWHHPHVPSGGACLGTIESVLPKALASYEFGVASGLLISYLQCCNAEDGWGRNIILWEDDAIRKEAHSTAHGNASAA